MLKRKIKKILFLLLASIFFLLFDFYYEKSGAKGYLEKIKGKISPTMFISPSSLKENNQHYPVIKIIDGDTIEVDIEGKREKVRLIGVNTPELNDKRKIVACFAKLAKEKTIEKLAGKLVRLESDPTQGDRDKYQRLLRYIFLEDKTNFNLWLIKEGYAYEYTYHFPYRYQNEFQEAQKKAREEKKGLWSDKIDCKI